MSTIQAVRTQIRTFPKGKPFTTSRFAGLGPRGAVDCALARCVRQGEIARLSRGVFVRPRKSRFVGNVFPSVAEVIRVVAKDNGETVQVHGAEAAQRLGLSQQVPTVPVFHTSASSRSIRVGNITARMIHTSNRRRLQFAGETAGLGLAALWYLGKRNATAEAAATIQSALGPEAFAKLRSADLPAWMATLLDRADTKPAHA